jgi:long-subunit acyl-CoA synthetase (AMP-forming)
MTQETKITSSGALAQANTPEYEFAHQQAAHRQQPIAHAQPVAFPEDALNIVARRAKETPHALALLSKQRGYWGAYRWQDLASELDRLRQGLAQAGVDGAARLAVSGAIAADLVLLALAAHAAGAQVFVIDRHTQGADLRSQLEAIAPTHAFAQERKTVSAWLACGYTPAAPLPLYSSQSATHPGERWRVQTLVALTGLSQAAATAPLARRTRKQTLLWTDEGTEWKEGLAEALAAWLTTGATLAAPESSASATRDRHELQPRQLLASPARQRQLQAELYARLAPKGHWQRRLLDWAAREAARPLPRLLLRRIARLHGLPAWQYPVGDAPTLNYAGWATAEAA